MGDPRRFTEFGKIISEYVSPDSAVVDVAGGKGYLQLALRENHKFKNVTSWDKRYRKNFHGHRYGWFNYNTPEKYQAVVAMHPDGGTDHAILYAAKHRCIAIVCPCCAIGNAVPYYGSRNRFPEWVNHLKELGAQRGLSVEERTLKINGKSKVLVFSPY